jgi:hypothetical protein
VATWWSPFVDGPTSNLAPTGINKIHPSALTTRALGVAVPSNLAFALSSVRLPAIACFTVRSTSGDRNSVHHSPVTFSPSAMVWFGAADLASDCIFSPGAV